MCDISVDDKACTSTGLQPLYFNNSTREMVLGPTGGCCGVQVKSVCACTVAPVNPPKANLVDMTGWTLQPPLQYISVEQIWLFADGNFDATATQTINGLSCVLRNGRLFLSLEFQMNNVEPVNSTSPPGTWGNTVATLSVNGVKYAEWVNPAYDLGEYTFRTMNNASFQYTDGLDSLSLTKVETRTGYLSVPFTGDAGAFEFRVFSTNDNQDDLSFRMYIEGCPNYHLDTTTNQLYEWNGTAWVASTDHCSILLDKTGIVYNSIGAGRYTRALSICVPPCGGVEQVTPGPCVSAVASLPANAAQIGYDCASKCFYAVPSTAKDAAGNTLYYDESRKSWGYINWTNWTSSAPGGSAGVATPANGLPPGFQQTIANGTVVTPAGVSAVTVEYEYSDLYITLGRDPFPVVAPGGRYPTNMVQYNDSTATIVTFNPPIVEPVLYGFGWGIGGANRGGPWTFSAPYEVLYTGTQVAYPNSTTFIESAEPAQAGGGSVFLRFPGVHSSITISSPGASDGEALSWGKYVTATPTDLSC